MFHYKKKKRNRRKGVRMFTETLYTSSITPKALRKGLKLSQSEYYTLCNNLILQDKRILVVEEK